MREMKETSLGIIAIMPVFNSENYLKRSIDSVINQSASNWRMIIVNDGSTDGSLSILEMYSKQDPRIIVINQSNLGAGRARNTGLDWINDSFDGYVVFIDSDDQIENDYFEKLLHHSEDLVFIDVLRRRNDTGHVIKKESISKYSHLGKDRILRMQMTGKIPWGGVRKACKYSIIKKHNIRFSPHTIGEEAIFSFDSLYHSESVGYIGCYPYSYFVHSDSLSNANIDNPWWGVAKNLKKHLMQTGCYNFFEKTINSLFVTAFGIAIKRTASKYAYNLFKPKAKEFFMMLKAEIVNTKNIDKRSLGLKARFVYFGIRCQAYFLVFLAGRLF